MRPRVHAVVAPIALLLAVTTATSAEAQERIGVGIGVRSSLVSDLQNLLTPTVYVPIVISDGLMIEPELGLVRSSEEEDETDETVTFLTVGAGLLFGIGDLGDGWIYAGPRLGFVRSSFSEELNGGEFSDSNTNMYIAGVLGGEFFLQPSFSLGGEAGLRYLDTGSDGADGSLFTTTAEFRVRWYFD
jgi:hypothetical protein